jgi:hypothetical protein
VRAAIATRREREKDDLDDELAVVERFCGSDLHGLTARVLRRDCLPLVSLVQLACSLLEPAQACLESPTLCAQVILRATTLVPIVRSVDFELSKLIACLLQLFHHSFQLRFRSGQIVANVNQLQLEVDARKPKCLLTVPTIVAFGLRYFELLVSKELKLETSAQPSLDEAKLIAAHRLRQVR